MKRVDLGAVFEVAASPIQSMKRSPHHCQRFREISGRHLGGRTDQPATVQHPLESGQRGCLFAQSQLAQFALDRSGANQAYLLVDQTSTRSHNLQCPEY